MTGVQTCALPICDASWSGAKVIAPRITAAIAAAMPSLQRLTQTELVMVLRVVHHPVSLAGRSCEHALDPAEWIAAKCFGGCEGWKSTPALDSRVAAMLAGVIEVFRKELDYSTGTSDHSVSAHVAAQVRLPVLLF